MREPMTSIEAERMPMELAVITQPHGQGPVRYIIDADHLARLTDSIRELHRQKRELYNTLHLQSQRR